MPFDIGFIFSLVFVISFPIALYFLMGEITGRLLRSEKSKIFKANVLLLMWVVMFFFSFFSGFSTCMCGHIAGIGHIVDYKFSTYILYTIIFVLFPLTIPICFFYIYFAMCSYRNRSGGISKSTLWFRRLENFLVSLSIASVGYLAFQLIWKEDWILKPDAILAISLILIVLILIFVWRKFSKITPLIFANVIAFFALFFVLNLERPNPEKDGVKGLYTAPQKVYEYDMNNDALDLDSRGLLNTPTMTFSFYKFADGVTPTLKEIFAPDDIPQELDENLSFNSVKGALVSAKINKAEFEKMRAKILGLVSLIDGTSETQDLRKLLQNDGDLTFGIRYSESDYGDNDTFHFMRGKIISEKNRCFYNIEIRAQIGKAAQ